GIQEAVPLVGRSTKQTNQSSWQNLPGRYKSARIEAASCLARPVAEPANSVSATRTRQVIWDARRIASAHVSSELIADRMPSQPLPHKPNQVRAAEKREDDAGWNLGWRKNDTSERVAYSKQRSPQKERTWHEHAMIGTDASAHHVGN